MEGMLCALLILCAVASVHALGLKQTCASDSGCDTGLVCQYGTCRAKIGTNCTTANAKDECVQNITCTASNTPCACAGKQVASADNTACVNISNVGGACTRDVECLTNGMCNSQKTCDCKASYVRSYDSTACTMAFGQNCTLNGNECGENSECKTAKCACKTGFSENNGRCAKTVGTTCTASSECGLMAECSIGTNKTCVCLNPYVTDPSNNFCKASSGAAVLSGSLLAAVALVVTSWVL